MKKTEESAEKKDRTALFEKALELLVKMDEQTLLVALKEMGWKGDDYISSI